MKTLNVKFEDNEFLRLVRAKGLMKWHDFIMQLVDRHESNEIDSHFDIRGENDDSFKYINKGEEY